jgi:hypothetical protein
MKKILLILFITFGSYTANAQSEIDNIIESFFKNYEEKGSTYALDNLYGVNKWIDLNGSVMMSLKEKMERLTEDFVGKYYGYELIVEKRLADSYVLRSYLVKYGRQPLRFTFQFYRPNNKWKLQNFQYDGDLDEEIEEAAKLYHFRLN